YERIMTYLQLGASWLVKWCGAQRLQPQLLIMMLMLIGAPLLLARPLPVLSTMPLTEIDPLFALMWFIGAACAIAAAWQAKYHRLAALILVGGTGIVTSLSFLWLSAPDLALTQLMVETVTTLLLLLGLRWLPPRLHQGKPTVRKIARRSRDLL